MQLDILKIYIQVVEIDDFRFKWIVVVALIFRFQQLLFTVYTLNEMNFNNIA